MRRLLARSTLVGLLALSAVPAIAAPKKAAPAKKAPAAKAKKKAAPPSAENKKKLLERMGGFKWGMSKDEIIATLEKQISEKYDEQLKDTTDVAKQDQIRKAKARTSSSRRTSRRRGTSRSSRASSPTVPTSR
jgi:hypothetical protein